MGRAFGALLAIAAAVTACSPARSVAPTSQAQALVPRTTGDLVHATLPGVVMLLRQTNDGQIGYGTGVLLDAKGLVLTNLHVVADAERLMALVHDGSRTTYSPFDGGLQRYLYENERAMVPVTLVRADPVLDIALVRLETDTSRLPLLQLRKAPLAVGDRVLVLGHPRGIPWTFTEGHVSALHQGMIQTDAPINPGNSGGPLVDEAGQVAGIVTSRLHGGNDNSPTFGVAFARPVALAQFLIDGATAPFEPDLSTPEKAVVSCARAHELGSSSVVRCTDYDEWYEFLVESTARGLDRLRAGAEVKAFVRRSMGIDDKKMWVDFKRRLDFANDHHADIGVLKDEEEERLRTAAKKMPISEEDGKRARAWRDTVLTQPDIKAVVDAAIERNNTSRKGEAARLLARFGLKIDPLREGAWDQLDKLGIRVERVELLRGDRAWISMAGRNADGTVYRFSELMAKVGSDWKERARPRADEIALLPKGWPAPFMTYDQALEQGTDEMLVGLAGRQDELWWHKERKQREAAAAEKKPKAPTPSQAGTMSGTEPIGL